MRALVLSLLAVTAVANAVACVEPVYDSDIGVEAIPIQPGEAAGTFALKTLNVTIVHVPALGDYDGGGVNYRLVTRTYDANDDVYEQESQLCGGYNFEVAGVVTESPESTYRKVPKSKKETVTVTKEGDYASKGHIQLWGLRDLPDPYDTNLPDTRDEAADSPWDDRIYDMDDDDHDGITLLVSGAVGDGEIYAFQRKTVNLTGVVLGPDYSIGLAKNNNEALTLGASNPLIDRQDEGNSEPHPDPKESYFEEARLPDGADCDDVMDAEDDEILSALRPF